VFDEIDAVHETAFHCLPFLLPSWRIAAECQYVLAAVRFRLLLGLIWDNMRHEKLFFEGDGGTHTKGNIDFLLWHVGACQVHTGLEANERLACLDHFGSEFGRAPAGIPVVA
jgi:hypothetical protein